MTANGNTPLGEVEYAELVARIQAMVATTVPPGASVLVISKGDGALLEMPGLRAAHFPQDGAGGYAGHHPLDSVTATAEIEDLRRRGAEYLVIPATSRWWLDHYDGFARYLATHCELMADNPDSCLLYGLRQRGAGVAGAPALARPQASVEQMRDFLDNLIPADATVVVLEADARGLAEGLSPLKAWRFPLGEGTENAEPMLNELKRLAAGDAEYLVVPRSADEWLDERADFASGIEGGCRLIADQGHLCRVFDLDGLLEALV